MNVIWRKVWSDLWSNKLRAALLILSVAIGVFAIGMIFGMSDQMVSVMEETWQQDMPQHITMYLAAPVSSSELDALRRLPGVDDIAPAGAADVRYQSARDDHWHQAVVMMRPDYDDQQYEILRLAQGVWPQDGALDMEHLQADAYGLKPGDTVTLQLGNTEKTFPLVGTIRHPYAPPPGLGPDLVFFFADAQEMAGFGVPVGQYNTLLVRVTPYSPGFAQQVASEIKASLAQKQISVVETDYQDPTRHWGRAQMDPLMLLMQVMAVAAMVLSAALVVNTFMALVAQQTHQMGIVKAIGGTRSTILKIYLVSVLVYGFLALAIAIPLGSLAAFFGSAALLNIYDIPHSVFSISAQAVLFQILAALVVPPLAALGPILEGTRVTVRQAFTSYGIGLDFGSSRIDRLVQRVGSSLLPSRYAIALANVFRRKRRLILTELVLVVAGALFLMLAAANSSVTATLDQEFGRRQYDLTIRFEDSQFQDRTISAARTLPNVQDAELVFGHPVSLLRPGALLDQAGVRSQLLGVLLEDPMYQPIIVSGRWLQPGDERAIVIGKDLATQTGFKVGDIVTLDLADLGRADWQIVGLHQDLATSQLGATNVYAPRDAIWQATNQVGWGNFLVVRTVQHDAASVSATADQLQNLYRKQNMPVTEIKSSPEERQELDKQFGAVVNLLMALALLSAVVGGIGLAGALSINVIERTKEVGVLRAIGARSHTIASLFVLESLAQVLLGWLLALPISLVGAPLLSNSLGRVMLGVDLKYQYNDSAVVAWLALLVTIGLIASILPARGASRISVRAGLAYE